MVSFINPLTGRRLRALGKTVVCPVTGAKLRVHADRSVEVARRAKKEGQQFSRGMWRQGKGDLDLDTMRKSGQPGSGTNERRIPISKPVKMEDLLPSQGSPRSFQPEEPA